MPLNIIRNDITRVSADAIVNTANPEVRFGAGVDQAIYEAAGADQLLKERAKIGPMEPGQTAVTPAFALDAKYIIHTVGPAWQGGDCGEREVVASCYRKSLKLAADLNCESIAFPLISTGTLGFPKADALTIALNEITSFLFEHDMMVYMVVYSREAFVVSSKAFDDIKSYIGDEEVRPQERRESIVRRRRRLAETRHSFIKAPESSLSSAKIKKLDDVLDQQGESFQQMLFRIIDSKGLKDSDVYKKANIDRKHFSKIRSNKNFKPKKKTALALAIALELDKDETIDLLRRADLAFNPSSQFDLIIDYCISNRIYNIFDINTYLFEYDQPLLGAEL